MNDLNAPQRPPNYELLVVLSLIVATGCVILVLFLNFNPLNH